MSNCTCKIVDDGEDEYVDVCQHCLDIDESGETYFTKNITEMSDSDKRINELEDAIKKRDKLVYCMMKGLSHNYQNFMVNDAIDIDKMCENFKVDETDFNKTFIKKKLDILGKDVLK